MTAKIEDGWHMQAARPLDTFTIPTALAIDGLIQADYPPHVLKTFTFSGGTKLAVYEGTIQIPFTAKLKNGATSVNATLHYQACNDTVCLPPRDASAKINVGPALSRSAPAESRRYVPLSAAPRDRLSSAFLSHGLPLTLLILFVGGLALNLTPCVFPMPGSRARRGGSCRSSPSPGATRRSRRPRSTRRG